MDNKVLSIISYITIVGWLIAYFIGKDKADDLLKYHLKQSLGIGIITLILNVVIIVVVSIMPPLAFISYIGYALFIISILGILNAYNQKKQPLPIIGQWADKTFNFIG